MNRSMLRTALFAVAMGAAMTSALGDPAVGFALGVGIAVALGGRVRGRCPPLSGGRGA